MRELTGWMSMDGRVARSERFVGFADPSSLARLLEPSFPAGELWATSEWTALLDHLLNTTIWLDIAERDQIIAAASQTLCVAARPRAIRSYYDLFDHVSPGVDLLRLVRTHGRTIAQEPSPLLPRPLGLLLHQAATAHAFTQHGLRLGSTGHTELLASIEWFSQQDWVPVRMKRRLSGWHQQIRSVPD